MKVRITCRYGSTDPLHPNGHTGIDLAFNEGTPLRSIGNGVARIVEQGDKGLGNGIIIEQADGTQAIYGHLQGFNVTEGAMVRAGEIIGYTGNTGRSTGPHLHFAVKDNGQYVDPTAKADIVANYAGDVSKGDLSWWERIIANGRVGDGYGDVPKFDTWGRLGESVTGWVKNGLADYATDLLIAFPVIAVACFGVYALCSIVNKRFATWGAGLTFIYGAVALLTI